MLLLSFPLFLFSRMFLPTTSFRAPPSHLAVRAAPNPVLTSLKWPLARYISTYMTFVYTGESMSRACSDTLLNSQRESGVHLSTPTTCWHPGTLFSEIRVDLGSWVKTQRNNSEKTFYNDTLSSWQHISDWWAKGKKNKKKKQQTAAAQWPGIHPGLLTEIATAKQQWKTKLDSRSVQTQEWHIQHVIDGTKKQVTTLKTTDVAQLECWSGHACAHLAAAIPPEQHLV